jgi:hypothetical protein
MTILCNTVRQIISSFKGKALISHSIVAMAKRPNVLNADENKPIIVALHGAGVEADSEFWTNSIPAQKSSWVSITLSQL